jgi:hypothetical protein
MKQCLFSRRTRHIGVGGTLALVIACSAASSALASTTTVDTSGCSDPSLTQPFLSVKDSNWYTLTPGESAGTFDGSGWTLSGGASIETTTLANGTTGQILNLPSGSKAVSPTICVKHGYETARTEVRDVAGSEGVQFYVSYEGTSTWNTPQNTGQVHGAQTRWTLSTPVNIQPSNIAGWQMVRFAFVPGGKTSDFQIYDFYVDPRMRW